MTVDTPERAWTDKRLDDLSKKVDDGFAKGEADTRELRKEMKDGFARVDERFENVDEKMEARFDKLDKKFDKLMWWLLTAAGGIILALIGHATQVY
jgi:tetrahydromethanopterin S-methyltransferase subunit G